MKFLLINLSDISKDYELNEYKIGDAHSLYEFVFNKEKIIKIASSKNNFITNIKKKLYISKINKAIYKVLDMNKHSLEKWNYVVSCDILNDVAVYKEVSSILNNLCGIKCILSSEMEENLPKYVLEHAKNEKVSEHEIKLLLVYKNIKDINYSYIEKLIKIYKKVNIYLKEKPTDYILNKIAMINKDNGSFIEIIKYNKKAFMEYNVIYFVQDLRINYPRLRLDKRALVIDNDVAECDKFNSNLTFLKQLKTKTNIDINMIEKLNKQYGELDIAYAVRKVVNH